MSDNDDNQFLIGKVENTIYEHNIGGVDTRSTEHRDKEMKEAMEKLSKTITAHAKTLAERKKPYRGEELDAAFEDVLNYGSPDVQKAAICQAIQQDHAGSNVTVWICATEDYAASLIEVLHYDWSLADLGHTYVFDPTKLASEILKGGREAEQVVDIFACYSHIKIDTVVLREWVYNFCALTPRGELERYQGKGTATSTEAGTDLSHMFEQQQNVQLGSSNLNVMGGVTAQPPKGGTLIGGNLSGNTGGVSMGSTSGGPLATGNTTFGTSAFGKIIGGMSDGK